MHKWRGGETGVGLAIFLTASMKLSLSLILVLPMILAEILSFVKGELWLLMSDRAATGDVTLEEDCPAEPGKAPGVRSVGGLEGTEAGL